MKVLLEIGTKALNVSSKTPAIPREKFFSQNTQFNESSKK